MNVQQQDIWLGDSSIYNTQSDDNAFQREYQRNFQTTNTNFSFQKNRGAGTNGNVPVYASYNFVLEAFKERNLIDSKMTIPIALFHMGGFAFSWYLISFAFLCLWNCFNSDSALITSMYTFTTPTKDVQDVVTGRRKLDFSFANWLFCGNADKRALFNQAKDKKNRELEITSLATAWRVSNCLTEI